MVGLDRAAKGEWVKVNIDGASKGNNPDLAGAGAIVRDMQNIGVLTFTTAEF